MTEAVPIIAYRNSDFPPETLTFKVEGVPVNLTGMTFAMDVRQIPGTGPALISLDTASDDTENGVRVVNAAGGVIRFQIDQASMQFAYDSVNVKAGFPVNLFYDLLAFDADGYPEALIEGSFIIYPGSTI